MKKMMIGIAAVLTLGSCTHVQGWFGSDDKTDSTQRLQSETAHQAALLRDLSINKDNGYSDLFLDSATLEAYLQKDSITGADADKVRAFYLVRNNQFAWFTSNGLTEQARALWSLYGSEPEAKEKEPGETIRQRMDSLLINDSLFIHNVDSALKKDPSQTSLAEAQGLNDSLRLQTELTLTAQLVKLSEEPNGVVTEENYYWLVPRKKIAPLQLADSLLNKSDSATLGSNNPQYTLLKSALKPYYAAAKAGGWQPLAPALAMRKGTKSPVVTALKRRLAATGDYPLADTSALYSDSLMTAIASVQQQYGLMPTGVVTDSLIAELNVPAEERLQQILVNMNRALWSKPVRDSAHIAVDIAAQELMAFDDSGNTLKMPVIVGKEGTGTMAFSGTISTVVFSPFWNLPESVVKNEILPAIQADPGYLKKHNMEIVKQGAVPQIRQLPGKENSLGQVKFLFPNSFDIYLHDTPNKALFAQQNRALSHGCIRVAKPDSLAAFVLRGQAGWTPEKIRQAMNAGKEDKVAVQRPVPVSITYYTAFAAPNGKLQFRRDVYSHDKLTAARMFVGTPAA